jgi:hypothetical protein
VRTLLPLALLLATGCAHWPKSFEAAGERSIHRHRPSGWSFPEKLEEFRLRPEDPVRAYDPEERNVSVSYVLAPQLGNGPYIRATAFVYPDQGADFLESARGLKKELLAQSGYAAVALEEKPFTAQAGGESLQGWYLRNARKLQVKEWEVMGIGKWGIREALDETYLFQDRGNFLKFRFTYETELPEEKRSRIEPFVRAFLSAGRPAAAPK